MSAVQLHLALNHSPLFAIVAALGFLVAAHFRRDETLEKIGLGALVVAALLVLPVYFTGEPTEELVEHLPGVSHALIHRHEEAAELAFVLTLIAGALSLGALLLPRWGRTVPKLAVGAVAALALVALGFVSRAAHFGGEIRHPEIRWDAGKAIEDVGLDTRTESHEPVDRD